MSEDLLGKNHFQVTLSLGNVANDLMDNGHREEAMKMMYKVLNMRIKQFGENHPRVADIYFNMGGAFLRLKQL
jgi:hypothetical protein